MFRFLHSADLHLGKPFGRFSEELRHRLRLVREGIVLRLAAAARAGGAGHILLAGDTFDAETPEPRLIHHTLGAMAAEGGLTWVILPGNHDSLSATELWRRMAAKAPANVMLAIAPVPIAVGESAVILPAPCSARRPGYDTTESLSAPTATNVIRIGLAHGAITDFAGAGSEDGNPAVIPPDRAGRSGLDYLALGDWHGQMSVGSRTWYAGTPEPDSFRHSVPGQALLVTLAGAGALPAVAPVSTGALAWQSLGFDVLPGEDAWARLAAVLPAERARTLLQLRLTGRLTLGARQALSGALDQVIPDFLHVEVADHLRTEVTAGDLDLIDRAGALRQAAEVLAAEAADVSGTEATRAIAAAALARLFELAGQDA